MERVKTESERHLLIREAEGAGNQSEEGLESETNRIEKGEGPSDTPSSKDVFNKVCAVARAERSGGRGERRQMKALTSAAGASAAELAVVCHREQINTTHERPAKDSAPHRLQRQRCSSCSHLQVLCFHPNNSLQSRLGISTPVYSRRCRQPPQHFSSNSLPSGPVTALAPSLTGSHLVARKHWFVDFAQSWNYRDYWD